MEKNFIDRGYDSSQVREIRERISALPRSETLQYKEKHTSKRIPFVLNYHPCNPPVRQWLHTLQDTIVSRSSRMEKFMPEVPVLAERKCPSLRTFIMPTVLPTTRDAEPGCYRCNRNTGECVICDVHLTETKTFTSSNTKETFDIRTRMDCNTNTVVYLLYCDSCPSAQYVGQTKNSVRTRFYQHRSNINKNTGTLVTQHFNKPGHSKTNMKCITVEKVRSSDPKVLDERERFWMRKLQTIAPLGLNTLD